MTKKSEISRVMSELGKRSAKARMKKIDPARRAEIAKNAAAARWKIKAPKNKKNEPTPGELLLKVTRRIVREDVGPDVDYED